MSKCCLGKCKAHFSKSNQAIVLKCKHLACLPCITEYKDVQNSENWVTVTCKECDQEEDLEYDHCVQQVVAFQLTSKIEDYVGEPLREATVICGDHNKQITAKCNKCNCFLCFKCQIDHKDHIDNIDEASEEIIF